MHRFIVETTISLLLSTNAPSIFEDETILTIISLINYIPFALNFSLSPFHTLYFFHLIIPLFIWIYLLYFVTCS